MAITRETVPMQKQILELHGQGMSDRMIAKIVGRNRRTIVRIIKRGEAVQPNIENPEWAKSVDWEKVRLEVARGTQMNILAREHAGDKISYVQFWRRFNKMYRPYKPRDKVANESAIGVVQKQFYQEVRDRKFYSLDELNSAFREYLERLNNAVMKDWGVSRRDRFEGEQELLKPCRKDNWEQAEWRKAKVHADCHVQVLKKFYSVPYAFVGREVRVRVTSKLIEIFNEDLGSLASHARLHGKEIYATNSSHYPAEKVALTQFSVQLALREAEKVGEETLKLVTALLSASFPLKHLRRVQGILRLHQTARVTRLGLEHAAKMAMQFNKLQYQYVQNTAEYFDRNGNRPSVVRSAPKRDIDKMYLHSQPTPDNREGDLIHDQ